jgi:hypothetical protein
MTVETSKFIANYTEYILQLAGLFVPMVQITTTWRSWPDVVLFMVDVLKILLEAAHDNCKRLKLVECTGMIDFCLMTHFIY